MGVCGLPTEKHVDLDGMVAAVRGSMGYWADHDGGACTGCDSDVTCVHLLSEDYNTRYSITDIQVDQKVERWERVFHDTR